jgi:imidazolonepropionase-like amidohydrolase
MSRPFSLLCALTLLSAAPAFADKPPVYALTGGRVVTVSGAVQDGATVVLRDGVIEAVGPGAKIPPDARVIDAKGLTVTPGLIDAFGGVGLPAPARSGGGGGGAAAAPARDNPLSPQSMVLDRVRPGDALKARDNGFTTALVVPAAGVLPGRSVLLNLAGETAEQMVWRQPAALHLHMSTLVRQYPGSLMGTVAYARQALYDARRYRELWAAYEKAPAGKKRPAYDPALAAWDDVIAGRIPLIVTATRENDLRRALALGDEFKVKVIAAGASQAAPLADLLKARKLPLLVSVNFDPPKAGGFFGGDGDDEHDRWEISEAERAPAALHQAGVPFALVSGHAPNALSGVRKAIDRGLPREAALRALTLSAAEALGIADRTGSLEAGKAANVTVWSGEPLAKDARVRMVFVDGRLYEPDAPAGKDDEKKDDKDKAEKPAADAKPPVAPREPPAVPARDASFAIMGATILTAGPQGTIEKGTILVKDGKIAAIGASVDLPSGLPVVNATGQFVTPGLIDAHSHTAIEGSVNECTDSVTAEVRVADVIEDHDIDIYRQLAGGVTAINVLHGSCNAIGGQNAVLKMRWGKPPADLVFKEAPRGIKFALGENPKRANFSVPGQKRYPGTRMGVEVVIREAFEDAKAYRREWEEYDRRVKAAGPKGEKPVAPRKDLRLETLVDVLDGKVLVHAHCYRSDEILMLIKVAEEEGFRIRTFQHVLEGFKVAREIAKHGAGGSTFSDWWAYKMEAHDAIPYNAAVMASKGVRVSLNSDSNELARRLYWEAAKAVKYGGVSEDEALKMVTANPAWQLGIDKYVGTLEVGKDADIAIFSAHPFAPDARVEMTLVEGTVVFDRERDVAARTAAPAGVAQ